LLLTNLGTKGHSLHLAVCLGNDVLIIKTAAQILGPTQISTFRTRSRGSSSRRRFSVNVLFRCEIVMMDTTRAYGKPSTAMLATFHADRHQKLDSISLQSPRNISPNFIIVQCMVKTDYE
jgi:hypothetical protein